MYTEIQGSLNNLRLKLVYNPIWNGTLLTGCLLYTCITLYSSRLHVNVQFTLYSSWLNGVYCTHYTYMALDYMKFSVNCTVQDYGLVNTLHWTVQDYSLVYTIHCTVQDYRLVNTLHGKVQDYRLVNTLHCKVQDYRLVYTLHCTVQDYRLVNTSHCTV